MKRLSAAALVAIFAALTAAGACSKSAPKVGEKCETNGQRACADPKLGLYCAAGVWQADTCKGPRGCALESGEPKCDVTANADGDPCPAGLDGWETCRNDGKSRVICQKGKYVVEQCPGKDGCTMEGPGQSTCSLGEPAAGGPCRIEGLQACSDHGKQMVLCKSGKFVLGQRCPGSTGCTDKGGGLVGCDPNGSFAEGDPCHFITAACTDGGSELSCESGKLVKKRECPGPDRCKPGACDTGLGAKGEACEPDKHACAIDGKALLACKPSTKKDDPTPNRWAVDKPCASSCTPKDGKLECK